jgi:hypothetical protein
MKVDFYGIEAFGDKIARKVIPGLKNISNSLEISG